LLVADIRRQLDRAIGRQNPLRNVAAGAGGIGDAIARLNSLTPEPTSITSPAPSLPATKGNPRRLVHALAEINIGEIDAAGMLLDANLAGARSRNVDLFVGQNLGSAEFVHAYRRNHFLFS
jgi:hypothetical protein